MDPTQSYSQSAGGVPPTDAEGRDSPSIMESCQPTDFSQRGLTMDHVMQLVQTITEATTTNIQNIIQESMDHGQLYIPPFDPDVRSHDVMTWCEHVDAVIKIGMTPQEARMRALNQLQGRAKMWAEEWALQTTTWESLKRDLIQLFSIETRYTDHVQKWREYDTDQANSYAEYATTGWKLFKNVRPEATDAEVIDALITGIKPDDIKCELLRNPPDSLPNLIATLKTYRKRKHNLPQTDNSDEYPHCKRPRLSETPGPSLLCCRCGKPCHRCPRL